jgi:hypothetical protein
LIGLRYFFFFLIDSVLNNQYISDYIYTSLHWPKTQKGETTQIAMKKKTNKNIRNLFLVKNKNNVEFEKK